MLKKFLIVAAAASLMAGSGFAAPAKTPVPKPKLIDVKTCPTSDEKVVGKGSGSEVVGKYRVYFCCGGCEVPFNKLSAKQKLAKVTALANKEAAAKKKAAQNKK
jgi:hypothetical protein